MSFDLTPEQTAVIEFAKHEKRSLLVNALAGAAKTTTLCLAAAKLPLQPTLCCAFNKSIATEMGKRMPSHIQCATMNSLGHRVWGSAINKRLTLATDKTYDTVSSLSAKARPEEKKVLSESFASLLRAARMAKAAGYIPPQFRTMGKSLVTQEDLVSAFAAQIDVNPDGFFLDTLDRVLELSIAEAFDGRIDFDDQIYMSTLFGGAYPKFPIVMVDEAQDLSPLNHLTITKMVAGRLIAVGDPNQAIYGFRGAMADSMSALKEAFSMEELTLSTSFRCPKKVVERAQSFVPAFRYPEWAKEGKVEVLQSWSADTIPESAAIICRNSAPLFRAAMKLIRAGRGIKLVGQDIGASLIKTLEKLGPPNMPQAELLAAIDAWEKTELAKAHEARVAAIMDRAECLRVFAEFGETLEAASAYAKHLFAASGSIQMMTGHKSKGLEFDVVFHLDPFLIPSKWAKVAAENGNDEQLKQEKNLRYVIETRSKEALYLIYSDSYQ
jgi:superfamily I DNA/RNA helicase